MRCDVAISRYEVTNQQMSDEWFFWVRFICYCASVIVVWYQEIATPVWGLARNDMVIEG